VFPKRKPDQVREASWQCSARKSSIASPNHIRFAPHLVGSTTGNDWQGLVSFSTFASQISVVTCFGLANRITFM